MKPFPFAIWPYSIKKGALTELQDMRGGVEKVTGQNLGGTPEKIGKIGDSIYPKIPASDTPTPATRVLHTLNDIHTQITKDNEGKGWTAGEFSKDPDFQRKYESWPSLTAKTLATQMFLERKLNDPNASLGAASMLRSSGLFPVFHTKNYGNPDMYPMFPTSKIENAFNYEVFSPLGKQGYQGSTESPGSKLAGYTPAGAIFAREKISSVPDLIFDISKTNKNEGGEIFYHGIRPHNNWDGDSLFKPDPRFLGARNLGNSLYVSRSDAVAGLYAQNSLAAQLAGSKAGPIFAFRTPKDFKWFDFTEKFDKDHEIHAGINEFLSRLAKIHGVEHVPWAPTTEEFWSNQAQKQQKAFQEELKQLGFGTADDFRNQSLINIANRRSHRQVVGSQGTLSGNELYKLFVEHMNKNFAPVGDTESNNSNYTKKSEIFHSLLAALGYDGSKENPLDYNKSNPSNQEVAIYPSSLHKLEHLGQHQGDWSDSFHEPITLEKLLKLKGQTGSSRGVLSTLLGQDLEEMLFQQPNDIPQTNFPMVFPKSDGTYGQVAPPKYGPISVDVPKHSAKEAYQEFLKTLSDKKIAKNYPDTTTLWLKVLDAINSEEEVNSDTINNHNFTLSVLQKFLNFFAHNKRRTDIPTIEPSWKSPQVKSFAATKNDFRKNYYLINPFPFAIWPQGL